jgi:very-short-patch-repair endonuclease
MNAFTRPDAPTGTQPVPQRTSIDARIATVASASHGITNDIRLASAGVTRRALRRRLNSASVFEVLPNTFAHAPATALTETQRRAAAVASLRTFRVALARTTAARLLEIWTRRDTERRVEVVSETHWRPSEVAWIAYHSSEHLPDEDIVTIDRLPVTNVIRTCLDLGMCLSEYQLANVLHEAEFKHSLDLRELAWRNEQRASYRGCDIVRRAIAARQAGSAGTRSFAEDILLEALLCAQLPVPAIGNPNATPLTEHEMDMVWPDLCLIVEVDGRPNHDRPGDRERDEATDRSYERIGWTVMRFDADDVRRDVQPIVATISRALAERRHRLSFLV